MISGRTTNGTGNTGWKPETYGSDERLSEVIVISWYLLTFIWEDLPLLREILPSYAGRNRNRYPVQASAFNIVLTYDISQRQWVHPDVAFPPDALNETNPPSTVGFVWCYSAITSTIFCIISYWSPASVENHAIVRRLHAMYLWLSAIIIPAVSWILIVRYLRFTVLGS